MPRAAAEYGTKPTLTASDIGQSSKIRAVAKGREAAPRTRNIRASDGPDRSEPGLPATMARHEPRCQAAVAGRPQVSNYLPCPKARHGPAILLRDQRDASKRVAVKRNAAGHRGTWKSGDGRKPRVGRAKWDRAVSD